MTVTATFLASRTLDHAFFGVNADGTLHVEIDRGGSGLCPTNTSPQAQYMLLLTSLEPAPATSPAMFLDYVGDMLGTSVSANATTVTLENIVYVPGRSLTLELTATFDGGQVSGHVDAAHCDSLDG